MRALQQVEFLALRDARIQVSPGDTVQLRGFKMIDEEKLNQLPAETFRARRAKGWIAVIYARLLSRGAGEGRARVARALRGGPRDARSRPRRVRARRGR